ARGVDDPPDPTLLGGGQHVQGQGGVRVGPQRGSTALLALLAAGEVEDQIDPTHDLADKGGVRQVGGVQLDAVDDRGEVVQRAGGEVVERPDVVVAADQGFDQVRSKEPRATDDETDGHATLRG